MDNERDAEDAIRGLDMAEFGRQRRRLLIEWTKQERDIRRPGGPRRTLGSLKPTKTLFVINFDPINTSPDYGRTPNYGRASSPYSKPEKRGSPNGGRTASPHSRLEQSGSPISDELKVLLMRGTAVAGARLAKMYTALRKIQKDKDVEPTEFKESVA